MNGLVRELTDLHNPGLCAFLLWRYADAYQSSGTEKAACPFILLFLVLPLLLNRETLGVIASTQTRSGIDRAIDKLGSGPAGRTDRPGRSVLRVLDESSERLRPLTCRALSVACQCALVDVDTNSGMVMANGHGRRMPDLPDSIEVLGKCAEKLGAWFASLSTPEIFQKLRVEP